MKKLIILLIVLSPLSGYTQYYDVLTHEGFFENGVKIRTQIPFNVTQNSRIRIEGFDDFWVNTIGLDLAWTLASSQIQNASASSFGGNAPLIKLGVENNKVVIHLSGLLMYLKLHVTASPSTGGDPSWFTNWQIVDSVFTSSPMMYVTYRNAFKDGVTVSGSLSSDYVNSATITNSGYIRGTGNSNRGYYTASSDNHLTQNAVYNTSSTWKSYSSKTNYGSAVVLQTEGKAGKALNVLVDTTISAGSEALTFTNLFTIQTDGKTGIGSTAPKELLQVNGNVTLNGNNKGYRFNSYYNSGNKYLASGYAAAFTLDSTGKLRYANTSSSGSADGSATLNNIFFIDKDGQVGIGTDTPRAKLSVNGDVYARKVKVTISGWPDYVFEPNYKLPDLKEVERFINANKHLPGVPSAKEIEKNGNDLGETQSVLLKKIEELTLYVIEQNKKIEKLEKVISQLEK